MSEEKKKEIEEMVDVLKDLNMEELLVVKGVGIGLRAAQELKNEQPQSVKNWRSERKEETVTTGELIRKHRKENKITQKKLGEMTGLAEITIRGYESNQYKPKIENIKKIAKALEIPVGSLMEELEATHKPLKDYSTEELLAEIIRRANDHWGTDKEI